MHFRTFLDSSLARKLNLTNPCPGVGILAQRKDKLLGLKDFTKFPVQKVSFQMRS